MARGIDVFKRVARVIVAPFVFAARAVRALWRATRWVARFLFGRLSWTAPAWPRWIFVAIRWPIATALRWLGADWRRAAAAALALFVSLVGYAWYAHLPKPEQASFSVASPGRTRIEDPKARPEPALIAFNRSVAPIDRVGKPVVAGIEMSPKIEGTWTWVNDRRLQFSPKNDWPVGVEYEVSLGRELIAKHIELEKTRARFHTARFEGRLSEVQFYQDPADPAAKKTVATLTFTHPVDPAELEKRITLRQEGQSGGFLGFGGAPTKFRVTYDRLKLNAYIHSEPLPIPAKDLRLDLTIDSGVRAAQGGNPTDSKITGSVTIPGLYSLRVQSLGVHQVENENGEPDRVVTVDFSSEVPEREVREKLRAWLLPVYHPDQPAAARKYPYAWNDPSRIGDDILKLSEPVAIELIAAERDDAEAHSFKLQADAGRYLYLRVDKGVKSRGGYLLEKDFDRVLRVQPFPRQVRLLSKGSLLALSGERKLPIMARDTPAVSIEIGRVLPQQLQNLVTMSEGGYAEPAFSGSFNESNLVERFNEIVDFPQSVPGRARYATIDFGRYLGGDAGRRGIFVVKAESYDPLTKRTTGASDRRLVVVTDLGIVVKKALDGTQNVFVQSIRSGNPVAGASVEVLGKNGLAVVTKTTDSTGMASIPDLKSFTRERQPALYLVRNGGDSSFLPFAAGERALNYSRFDVGGVANAADGGRLSAYLFSDRGLYRPGDEFHIGLIVKAADWGRKLAGIPLEADVADPRGMIVRREKFKLSNTGFDELKYATQETSPTGDYSVQLYIVKDGMPSNQIGSISVKVQEFLPDRMKMTTHLSAEAIEGWVSPQDLRAHVLLQNLFGTPAQNRRVRGEMTLTPAYPVFASYRDYRFYDPQRAKEDFQERLPDAMTDAKGEADFDLNLGRFARATYRVRVIAQGYEAEGGRSVSSEASTLVSSMPYLVGWKADGDLSYVPRGAERRLELIAINPQAKRVDADKLVLARIERRFVSVLTRQNNGTYRYESRPKETVIDERPFKVAAAGSKLALATETPGSFAYALRDAAGQELARVNYAVAGKGNLSRSLDRNAELQVTLNKRDYQPGEEIEMQIQAPYTGAGLITIERERVYSHVWFKTSTTSTTQRIRVPRDFEGNGYVNVAFIRDPGSDEIYMSPLSYGVVPFSVNLERRKSRVEVKVPDRVKPGDTVRFEYRTDRPAKLVLFAVDEGILQVARYKTADPLGYFFQKRALDVKTFQILDLILPEYRKLMEAAAPGGDAEGAISRNLNPFKRKRDKPVAFWSGIVDSDRAARSISWKVPDYFNGSLRVMAVAASEDTLGVFEKRALVRADIVLSPNAPTTVTPGDEFDVSVGVANNLRGSGASPSVKLALKTSAQLEVLGKAEVELKVGEMRESSASFRVRAKDALGSATLAFTAELGASSARHSVDVSVRPATPHMTRLSLGTLTNATKEVALGRELYPQYRRVEASLSHLPLGLAHGLAAYLDNFAYSCTEQLVSQGVPALVFEDRSDLGAVRSRSGKTLLDLFDALRARQNDEGGFGMWAANHHVVDFASVYAMHFLIEAKERGKPVPPEMLAAGNAWLRRLAASEGASIYDERARAYAVYLLTRQGTVTSNLAAALQKRLEQRYAKEWPKDIAAGYLAASYQLMKQERLAERLFDELQPGPLKGYSLFYDSMSRDAQIVYLAARHFPARLATMQANALASLVKSLQLGVYNSFSAAYTILALDAVASLAERLPAQSLSIAEIARDGRSRALALPPGSVPRVEIGADAARVEFGNGADLAAYYVVSESGFDRKLPDREIKKGLEVVREYTDLKGNPVSSVKLGEEVEVRLKFRAIDRDAVGELALVDLLPGGFELVTEPAAANAAPREQPHAARAAVERRPASDDDEESANEEDASDSAQEQWNAPIGTAGSSWRPEYADLREDRVVLYGQVGSRVSEFVYRIKATNSGSFVVPPAYGESMYEREVQARSLGGRITVQK